MINYYYTLTTVGGGGGGGGGRGVVQTCMPKMYKRNTITVHRSQIISNTPHLPIRSNITECLG